MLSKQYRSEKLMNQVKNGICLLYLQRLNPIFKDPVYNVIKDGVIVIFSGSRHEQRLQNVTSDLHVSAPSVIEMFFGDIGKQRFKDTHLWIVVDNLAVRYSYKVEKPYARYFLFKEAPPYIQTLAIPAIRLSKKSVVTIVDDLPLSLVMTVTWNRETSREDVLNSIAHFLEAQQLQGVSEIRRDKNISFRWALDNIQRWRTVKVQSDVSYCLKCGGEIERRRQFCYKKKIGEGRTYENRNNCLTNFNHWLKGRLGIQTKIERKKKRNELYKEMLELIKEFPLTAHDELKRRHPKLYEKRYKERWERERRLKQKEKT